jgi:hypothetical protein
MAATVGGRIVSAVTILVLCMRGVGCPAKALFGLSGGDKVSEVGSAGLGLCMDI